MSRRKQRHATGPITPAGKQISSQNATTHGLTSAIPGQGTAEFERIRARFFIEYKPQTLHRRHLVAMIASASWRLERIDLIEAAALDLLMGDVPAEPTLYHKLAEGMGDPALIPDKLLRHRNAADRQYRKAHQELTTTKESVQNELPHSAAIHNRTREQGIQDNIERQKLYSQIRLNQRRENEENFPPRT
jgi:hypothetical protein